MKTTEMELESLRNQPMPEEVEKDNTNKENNTWKFWQKQRYIVAILSFFAYFISSILQVNMSIAIVAMTSNTSETEADFNWDSKMQGHILSSPFYGYMSTMILGGWLSSRVGGKKVLGIGIGVDALLTAITPPLAKFSIYYLITLRVIGGMFQGLAHPCIHEIWKNWAPPSERSKLGSVSLAGHPLGIVFGLSICGVIAERLGWEPIFYITGAIGLVFVAWWHWKLSDDPADSPNISSTELKYIKQSLGHTNRVQKKISHPWKAILTSSAVWAIIIVHFSKNWGTWIIFTGLPQFMTTILNFKIEKTGFLSSLPYILLFLAMLGSGYAADYLQTKKKLATTRVRKIFTCSGLVGEMIFMTLVIFCENPAIIVICISVAIGFSGISTSGFCVNHLDIAPQHASVLLGMSSTAAMFAGILSPILTGYIVQDQKVSQWHIVFIIANAICLIGAITYGFLASGKKQKWAEEVESEPPNTNDEAVNED